MTEAVQQSIEERTRDTGHVSRVLSLRFWLFVVSIEPIVRRTWQVR